MNYMVYILFTEYLCNDVETRFGCRFPMNYHHLSYDQVRTIVTTSASCEYKISLTCTESSMHDNGWQHYSGTEQDFMYTEGIKGISYFFLYCLNATGSEV